MCLPVDEIIGYNVCCVVQFTPESVWGLCVRHNGQLFPNKGNSMCVHVSRALKHTRKQSNGYGMLRLNFVNSYTPSLLDCWNGQPQCYSVHTSSYLALCDGFAFSTCGTLTLHCKCYMQLSKVIS